MDRFDPEKWKDAIFLMIRTEVQAYFVFLVGIAFILFLGFAIPIAGKHIANERIKAEQAAELRPS